MGDVKILYLDAITEKSGHSIVPMAVSVCIRPRDVKDRGYLCVICMRS
jgi:hypothetical protein